MKSRHKQIQYVLIVTMLANIAVSSCKLILGIVTGSLSLLADAFHSFLDCISNIVGLVGIALSNKPPDAEHPYGHSKFETLAAMGISFMLGIAAIKIAEGAIQRFGHPTAIEGGIIPIGLLLATIVINISVSVYEARRGKELQSEVLLADSQHTRSDFYAASVVVIALVSSRYGIYWADPVAAIFVVLMIGKAAYEITKKAADTLTDAARIDDKEVREFINSLHGVDHCHKVRTRGVTGEIFMDMHLRVDPGMNAAALHKFEHKLINKIHQRYSDVRDVMIHFEPHGKA